jgi:hypothetical protein
MSCTRRHFQSKIVQLAVASRPFHDGGNDDVVQVDAELLDVEPVTVGFRVSIFG